ncbi:MAG: phosphoribosylglycinamide formyltransferase [Acidimicrobiales bacterium]
MRIGVLASGRGTILAALAASGLPLAVAVVDRRCGAESAATRAGIPLRRLERTRFDAGFDRAAYGADLVHVLRSEQVDLVAMAGFATVLDPQLFDAFGGRVLNTHPSLLPAFRGWHAVEEALRAGVGFTGCTVHVATVEVDRGPILAQEAVPVLPGDTVEMLHERIKRVERRLYPDTLWRVLRAGGDPAALVRDAGSTVVA